MDNKELERMSEFDRNEDTASEDRNDEQQNYSQQNDEQSWNYAQQDDAQGRNYGQNQNYGQQSYDQYQNYNGWQQPQQPQEERQTFGIVSLVLGIISLLLFCTCINWLTGIAAIVFGIIQIVKYRKKGLAIGGIVTAGLSLLCSILLYVFIFISYPVELYDQFYNYDYNGYSYDAYDNYDSVRFDDYDNYEL